MKTSEAWVRAGGSPHPGAHGVKRSPPRGFPHLSPRRRKLSLADALTYEALFGVPASALFPGEYERARALVQARAASLLGELARSGKETAATRHKRVLLEELVRRVQV